MTTPVRDVEQPGFKLSYSAIVVVGDTIDLDGLRADYPHCFVGVQFFADAEGAAPAVPGAGTVLVTVATVNTTPSFEVVPNNTITAPTPTTVPWDGNTAAVKLVPTGITTATHWRAVVTQNRS